MFFLASPYLRITAKSKKVLDKLPIMGHNNIMKKFLIPLLCLSSGTVLASESNCDYKTVVNTDFQGTITSSKNYNKTTYPHVEDTRKCIIKLDVKINNGCPFWLQYFIFLIIALFFSNSVLKI